MKAGRKTKKKPLFSRVSYTIAPIQEFAHWEGVLHPESMWCYPDQGDFKMKLRNMISKHSKHLKNAKTLQKHILEEFSAEKQYAKFADSVWDVFGASTQSNIVKVYG